MVTAEAVMVLPVLVLVTLALSWLVGLGVTQVRVVDAARETARAAARDDDPAASLAAGRRVAPDGASVSVASQGDEVVATVRVDTGGPPLLGWVPGVQLSATAVAAREER
ncbi:pilus assembly protein [Nocardioides sp. ChNu-153]|nr:pilus assembly protein [Nocardioides sp. ChNu-99]MDN7121897.1 pilus assembly protein [Nocardioides sp. ChNu-153]